MNENLITIIAITAIVAISLGAFVAFIAIIVYFTEKKIIAGLNLKTEAKNVKTETDLTINAENEK